MGQITLRDVERQEWTGQLSGKERAVLRLLDQGITASQASRLADVSRSGVSRLISMAVSFGLLREAAARANLKTYSLTASFREALAMVKEDPGDVRPITLCNPHNIRLRYKVMEQSGHFSRDKRAGFIRAWQPKGPERLIYWISGRGVHGDITVEAHPGALVAYYAARQDVIAPTVVEAENLIRISIHEGILRFLAKQADHGCRIHVGAPMGSAEPVDLEPLQVTATHYAFQADAAGPVGAVAGLQAGAWWVDRSPEDDGDPDHVHVETKEREAATAMDRALHTVGVGTVGERILALEEIGKVSPSLEELKGKVGSIEAHLSSGTVIGQKMDQMVGLLAATLLRMERLENKIRNE